MAEHDTGVPDGSFSAGYDLHFPEAVLKYHSEEKKNHKKEKNPKNPLLVLFINLSRSRQREERGLKAQLALVAAAR